MSLMNLPLTLSEHNNYRQRQRLGWSLSKSAEVLSWQCFSFAKACLSFTTHGHLNRILLMKATSLKTWGIRPCALCNFSPFLHHVWGLDLCHQLIRTLWCSTFHLYLGHLLYRCTASPSYLWTKLLLKRHKSTMGYREEEWREVHLK